MNASKANSVSLFLALNTLIPLLLYLPSAPASSQPTIVLNTAAGFPISNQFHTGFGDKVLTEAFKRIGYKLEISKLPAERALINANMGIDDGDLIRVGGLQEKYPNLIQVPEKIMDIDLVLLTKNNPLFIVKGWHSVDMHTVGIINGWKVLESNFCDHVETIKADNVTQLFTLLKKNRVDFIVYSRWSSLDYIKKHNTHNVVLLDPSLINPSFYTYLHKKHKKIVPKLANAIKNMKIDGTIDSIYKKILMPYLKKN